MLLLFWRPGCTWCWHYWLVATTYCLTLFSRASWQWCHATWWDCWLCILDQISPLCCVFFYNTLKGREQRKNSARQTCPIFHSFVKHFESYIKFFFFFFKFTKGCPLHQVKQNETTKIVCMYYIDKFLYHLIKNQILISIKKNPMI